MDVYDQLGIKELINAAGTYTIVGGSRMSSQTLEAMAQAAHSHVDLGQLRQVICRQLAQLTGNEGAYVTCGAAAGLYLATAAAVAKKADRPLARVSPEEASQWEVIIQRSHRNGYDWSLRQLGVKIVEVGYPNDMSPTVALDLVEAITPRTAAVMYTAGGGWVPPGALSFDQTIEIAGEYNLPVIVDAAAQLPPVENLWRFTEAGAAACVFSGGKDLKGPQASGLLVGKKWLIDLCLQTGFPNHGIGRMLKVGREEMVGLWAAVQQYVQMDHIARERWCEEQVTKIRSAFAGDDRVEVTRVFPNEAGQPLPRAVVRFSAASSEKAISEVVERKLLEGDPAIYVKTAANDAVYVNPMTLTDAEVDRVILRLQGIVAELFPDEL